MSIQSNFPAIAPTLLLDFANVKALDPRVTFARASTATYYGTQTAKAEENLLLQSQAFNENAWQKTQVTATANSIAAPDGTTTADTLTNNTVNTLHIAYQAATLNGQAYTFSVFAKKGTADFVYLRGSDGTSARMAWFNLATGAVGTVETNITASITDVGNGWYRCVGVWSISSSASANYSVGIAEADGVSSYAGTTKDIYLWGAQLEQRSAVTAYTATTTQPITNYVPQLLTAASGVARFDHNPITDESLGLLIEEQRTNLFTYSEDFANAAWQPTRASITANTIVAPDGTLTGDKLVEDTTATNTHSIRQNFTLAVGTYTYSVFAKAGERTVLQCVRSNSNIDLITHTFDLATGVATGTGASMTSVGNGWYRCVGVITVNTAAAVGVNFSLNDGSTITYTGDGYSGLFLWGAQLEAGAFPTSYIQTVASQVTRAADAASMTGTNFSSWYNQAEGSLYAEWQKFAPSTFQAVAIASDGSGSNIIALGHGSISGVNNSLRFDVTTGGVNQASITSIVNSPSNTFAKTAAAYAVDNFSVVSNGGSAGTDTSGVLPVVNRLIIGANAAGTGTFLNGTIRKVAYYPLRISNTNLVALTS